MRGGIGLATAIVGLLAVPGIAQGAGSGITIGGTRFTSAEIVDARALPDLGGAPTIMITLDDVAARRLDPVVASHRGKALPIAVDGTALSAPVLDQPAGAQLIFPVEMTIEQAEATALHISGKPPLRDEFEE